MFPLLSKYIEFTTLLRVLIIYTSIKAHNFYISGLQKSYIIHGQILLTFQTNQHQTCKKDYFSFRNTVLGPVYHTKLDINRFKLAFYVFDVFNSCDQTPKFSCLCISYFKGIKVLSFYTPQLYFRTVIGNKQYLQ